MLRIVYSGDIQIFIKCLCVGFFFPNKLSDHFGLPEVIQSFFFSELQQCWLWQRIGDQVFVTCSSIFSLEQTAFSTGQDGAIRSVGEELKTTSEISYYQNSFFFKDVLVLFLWFSSFEYYFFTESECHYKH